jgi:AraC family transcriptional regulator
MDAFRSQAEKDRSVEITFSRPDIVRRRHAAWNGIKADIVEITRLDRLECGMKSSHHVLIACERAERENGETVVEGFQRSTQREFSRRLCFIPAGHRFHGWQDPRVLARGTFLYIDPNTALADPELRFPEIQFTPRLFFFDNDIWETALKLKAQVENPRSPSYAEALGAVLIHELVRLERGSLETQSLRGGLAGWQRKKVAEFIEAHLHEEISLQHLAEIAQLSRYHFGRAFKRSFGVPPHRYHMNRRLERAKSLLRESVHSVTEVGLMLGFAETSSFTTSFRRAMGVTPTDYRRALL